MQVHGDARRPQGRVGATEPVRGHQPVDAADQVDQRRQPAGCREDEVPAGVGGTQGAQGRDGGGEVADAEGAQGEDHG